ncbi:stage II sporulation protein spoIIQ [Bacillaceae bacterium]
MSEEQNQRAHPEKSPVQAVKRSGWKKIFGKKWTFPAIYMGAAALILALIMWYQDPNDFSLSKDDLGLDEAEYGEERAENDDAIAGTTVEQEAVPVTSEAEQMIWPAEAGAAVDITTGFFEENASEEAKAAAVIQYENQFWPHTGIDLATKDNQPFTVVAALSGKVVKAEKDPMVGYLVEIEHPNNLTTVYQSLAELQVKAGDQVQQGDPLGKAGRNQFEKDSGVHLHFEVRENGEAVSPDKHLSQGKKQPPQQQ